MTELKCSVCVDIDDPEGYFPPNCPVCGGFIKWIDEGENHDTLTPICNKCGSELIMLPYVEDGEVIEGMNKICPISKPKKSLHSKEKEST